MVGSVVLALSLAHVGPLAGQQVASTGRMISPVGTHVQVGFFPCNMALSPDGGRLLVTTAGHRQFLTVLDTSTGKILSQQGFNERVGQDRDGLYFGLAWGTSGPSAGKVYAAQGALDRVSEHRVGSDGTLGTATRTVRSYPPQLERRLRGQAAGLALNSTGDRLYVVNNGTSAFTDFNGSLSILNLESGATIGRVTTAGFPLDVKLLTLGPRKDRIAYVSSERDGVVQVVDVVERRVLRSIKTGAQPTHLLLDRAQRRLFVANSGSDTVSVVSTVDGRVLATHLVRPDAVRGLPGSAPLGLALSPDEKTLYVACADLNAVAVIDLAGGSLRGYVPTGWYPTAVAVSPDGKRLFIASGKGIDAVNPNATKDEAGEQHPLRITPGTVTTLPIMSPAGLARMTARVVANNRLPELERLAALVKGYNPGIEHCIYIVKENRTYDQVLGDLPQGNGDPKLCLFPREVTPNQHALAERFVLLDNFYVCAEVSADGWSWSVAGMTNEYNQRNSRYNYAGRGREYDFEGQNNGTAVDLRRLTDVSAPEGGYFWDACARAGVSYRNYGMYSAFGVDLQTPQGGPISRDNLPTKAALVAATDPRFRRYDLNYADSPAWHEYGQPCKDQLKEFGGFKSRFEAWKAEFDRFVLDGDLPALSLVRLGNDHTSGTRAGHWSPRAMVADNDYAVGLLVEAVSKSPYWTKTAIFILEDDAQAGIDHVDCHRSTAYVISPFVPRGTVDSRFYNTDSMLRTMAVLLGLEPWNQFLAVSEPFRFFGRTASNAEPFVAIRPAASIVGEINQPTAYRSADSARLVNRFVEESAPDVELNDILWKSIKGAHVPTPRPRRNVVLRED